VRPQISAASTRALGSVAADAPQWRPPASDTDS
jgi:hypothetical protein